jgi:hypothetical protein
LQSNIKHFSQHIVVRLLDIIVQECTKEEKCCYRKLPIVLIRYTQRYFPNPLFHSQRSNLFVLILVKRLTLLVPGFLFGIIFILNLFIWSKHSSSAIPFGTFVGAYFGYKKKTIEQPVRTNPIPRQIPEQSLYLQPFVR